MSTEPRQSDPLDRMLRRAVRRVRLAAAIDGLAAGLRVGGIAGMLVLAVDRVARLGLPPATAAGIVAAGALIGLVPAMRRRVDPVRVASRLDAALGLRDRLGTAAALAGGGTAMADPRHDPAFAGLVHRDASAAARGLDPRVALPLTLPRSAAHAAALLVVLVLGWIFVPEVPRSPEPSAATAMATLDPTEQEELARTLAEAAERFGEHGDPLEAPDEAGEAQVRARDDEIGRTLEDLARQLAPNEDDPAADAGERDATEIRDEAVRELTDAAGELEQQARRDEQVLDELTDRFSGLQPPASAEQDEQIGRLAEALRRGAFDEAGDALDEIARNGGEPGGDPEAARRRAEALRSLAEQAAARARAAEREAEAAAEEQNRRLNEAVDELTGETPPADAATPESEPERPLDPEEIQRRLEEAGADPELTERLVDEARRLQEQQQLDEAIRRDAESVERSLEEAAEQLAPPSPDTPAEPGPPSPPEGTPGGEQQQQQQSPGEQTGEQQQPGAQGGQQQQPGAQGGQQQQQPGAQGGEQQQQSGAQGGEQQQQSGAQGGEQQQQPGAQGGQQQQQQPGGQGGEQQQQSGAQGGEQQQQSGAQGGEQQQQPGAQGGQQQQQQPGAQGGQQQQQPGGQGGQQQQQPGGQGGEQQQPGGQGGQQQQPGGQGGQQQQPQGGGQGGDGAGSQPSRGLRELAERRQQAEDARRRADEAREFARRVGSHLSPEEQRRFAERFASEPSGSGIRNAGSDPRDISRAAAGGESIAELPGTGEGPLTRPGSSGVRTRPADPEDAARTAERAVAERRIPDRYHEMIRRYFDRLRTTDGAAGSGNAAGDAGS